MIVEALSLLAAFCFTCSGILVVFALKGSNPTSTTLISMLTNVVFLWPVAFILSPISFDNRAMLLYAVSAAFAPFAGRLLNGLSLEKVGVSTATSISGLQPLIVAVLASILLAERLPPMIYGAIIITVIGVVIVGRSRHDVMTNKSPSKWDLLFPLSSTSCYAASNIARKEGLKVQKLPLLAAAITCSVSTVYLFLALLFTQRFNKIVITRSSLFFSVLSGIATSLAWIFSFQALNLGDASIVSTILAIQPILTIALCYVFLRETETITVKKTVGASLVVLGVILISVLK